MPIRLQHKQTICCKGPNFRSLLYETSAVWEFPVVNIHSRCIAMQFCRVCQMPTFESVDPIHKFPLYYRVAKLAKVSGLSLTAFAHLTLAN